MNKKVSKLLCLLLVLIMTVGLLPTMAFAADQEETYTVTGFVKDAKGAAVEGAAVACMEATATTDASGKYTLKLGKGTAVVTAAKAEHHPASVTVTVDKDCSAADLVLNAVEDAVKDSDMEVLTTDAMKVYVSKTFPSVVRYEMKDGKVFYGQEKAIHTIAVNGQNIELTEKDVEAEFKGDRATYVMTVKGQNVDAVITAELVAEDNTLAFNITKIENKLNDSVNGQPVQTIAIPNHSLISVNTNQKGANLKAAAMSSNTTVSGDEYYELTADTQLNRDYMYAFVSNEELSAGLWSNSEHNADRILKGNSTIQGGSRNTRMFAKTTKTGDQVSLGLESAPWYYHRVKADLKGKNHMVTETELPKAKVIISADQNDDKQINWQDGAIAFRGIMNNPYLSEEVPELVSWRIAMNFGGQAQNPFLTTLDNVKRVAMHTDGLGQSVLLKGYASEGHDSGHPDYADIGKRIGGAEDMNTMMEKGRAVGARFGIHVNAGEMYPEAQAFSNELVGRRPDHSLKYGWNWLDQAVAIDSVYDLGTGQREARFDALKELVGDNMDFVYVDIWGNRTGGNDDSWETRKLSKEIVDNGWRMCTEWGAANEYDSTFQHWATDLTYGGYTMKGENSEVMRFLRNHQKDSWVGNYYNYGGAAMAPLLGGYNMKDFEGWQGRNDYDAWIVNLYSHDLTTKFIQHFEIMKWVDGEEFTANNGKVDYTWTPEMEITLRSLQENADGSKDTLVLTRGSNNPEEEAYRDRTMTLNGKVIATGSEVRADQDNKKETGTEKYLLPWNWDVNTGKPVAEENEKLYHWNTQGGDSTWELPDSWAKLKTVYLYELTDLGKVNMVAVPVKKGEITLKGIKAQTPYVLFRTEKDNLDITWSEGMHIVDAGFNTGDAGLEKYWEKTGTGAATIAKSQYSNPMLKLDGEVSMSQTLTDLTPGQKYAVLVGVDNRSDSKAAVTVKADGKVMDSNYTVRSIAKNYVKAYTHSNISATVDGTSYFQNMYVYFTAPESGTVTLELSKEAGEGSAYFDDVRVTETAMDVIQKDDKGVVVGLQQNFEDNVQGVYPFVIGSVEGVEDNRTHLSQLHAPYTQAGWDVKKMDDVLTKNDPDSQWSVKTNGLCGGNALIMQTIPQNFRFEPYQKYRVTFDYQQGSDNTYGVAIGDGEVGEALPMKPLPKAMGAKAEKTYTFEMVGAPSGQSWFGIFSTNEAPNLQGVNPDDAAANFGGYQDFVLDNLKIEKVEDTVTRDDLKAVYDAAAANHEKENYQSGYWADYEKVLNASKAVLDNEKASEQEVAMAKYDLEAAVAVLEAAPGLDATDELDIAPAEYAVKAGSTAVEASEAELAQDGKNDTCWSTAEDDVNLDKAWYQFDLKKPQTVDGLRYLPRVGPINANGKLLKAKIQISKDNGKTWTDAVASAEFTLNAEWQKVKFAQAEEGVTNVKVVPMETAGQSPKEVNRFASAAELRLTHPVG